MGIRVRARAKNRRAKRGEYGATSQREHVLVLSEPLGLGKDPRRGGVPGGHTPEGEIWAICPLVSGPSRYLCSIEGARVIHGRAHPQMGIHIVILRRSTLVEKLGLLVSVSLRWQGMS